MDLYVWDGENNWGLPSMDLDSLQMLAYVKFSGAPVNVIKTLNPFRSPTGHLPALKSSDGVFSEFSKFTSYLRQKNFSCDYDLSPRQCSEVVAYEQLLLDKLYPAIMYLWWVEPKSHFDVIRKWYFQNIPFPFKFWYPWRFQKTKMEYIYGLFDEPLDIQSMETELHKHAQECLTMLSNRLGERDYFLGHKPSTIDAIVYSYLSILLKVELKVSVLQNHIKASPNLSRYVSRITQRYFPSDPRQTAPTPDVTTTDDVPNKGRNLILSGIIAGSAMFGYAIAAGLVQVDMKNKSWDVEYDDHDYEEPNDTDSNQG